MTTREYIRNRAMLAVLTEIGSEYGRERTVGDIIESIKKKVDFRELE